MEVKTIGRASNNDIVINDAYASRYHCQLIHHDNGLYELVDMSSYGTFVNGKKIKGKAKLNHGDIVKIGNTCVPWMRYFSHDNVYDQHTVAPSYEVPESYYNHPSSPVSTPPIVNIPSEININKKEEYSNVAKRGDDFSVSFNRNMGDKMGDAIGTTLGCVVSAIIIIVVFAIIGLIISA